MFGHNTISVGPGMISGRAWLGLLLDLALAPLGLGTISGWNWHYLRLDLARSPVGSSTISVRAWRDRSPFGPSTISAWTWVLSPVVPIDSSAPEGGGGAKHQLRRRGSRFVWLHQIPNRDKWL